MPPYPKLLFSIFFADLLEAPMFRLKKENNTWILIDPLLLHNIWGLAKKNNKILRVWGFCHIWYVLLSPLRPLSWPCFFDASISCSKILSALKMCLKERFFFVQIPILGISMGLENTSYPEFHFLPSDIAFGSIKGHDFHQGFDFFVVHHLLHLEPSRCLW